MVLEFLSMDWGFFEGLVVAEFCCFYLFLSITSTATGFIITLALVANWTFFPFYPVVNNFEVLITSAGFWGDESILFLIVDSKFFIPCSFFFRYLSYYLLAYYDYFDSFYFFFFKLFDCAFLPWNELLRESHNEFKDVLWASLALLFLILVGDSGVFT